MKGLGTIVNVLAVIPGSGIGILFVLLLTHS